MAYETILTEQDGAALVITFNRPDKRNALSLQTIDDVADALRKAAAVEGWTHVRSSLGRRFDEDFCPDHDTSPRGAE